eukprot:TRINITY_DN2025_c0_g1_i2.p1 TRINITY_DN2025_c0_g1~~TRINITY_DN2025_c0_g1_i2.p1  ORF type:complete len:308 (+),score=74.92 TRINITY_DN2025_c0_g1_i2:60-983(+)
MAVQYSKLNKPTKDLLTKEFSTDNKIEVVSAAANGAKFTAGATLAADVLGEIEVEYTDVPSALTVKAKHDTKVRSSLSFVYRGERRQRKRGEPIDRTLARFHISRSQKKLFLEASVSGKLIDGGKLIVESTTVDSQPTSVKAAIEFANKSFSTAASYDLLQGTASVAGLVSYEGFLLGGEAELAVSESNVKKTAATLAYSAADFTVAATVTNAGQSIATSYLHKLKSGATVAAEYVYGSKASFTVAGKYPLDKDSYLKGKVTQEGQVSLTYNQKIKPNVGLALVAEIATAKTGSGSQKVGFQLSFTD